MAGDNEHHSDQIKALIELWSRATARRTERRSFEWKLAFGVWGAQLAALGLLLNHGAKGLPGHTSVYYLGAGIILFVLHLGYVGRFIRPEQHKDANEAKRYESRLRHVADPEGDWPDIPTSEAAPWTWVHALEAGVTLILALVGPVAMNRWH